MSRASERNASSASGARWPGWLLALAVGVPNALGALSGSYRHTFDAWVHIFFADHYLRGWFEVWEPRWYGGFSVLTYPPLAHQLVAALGAAFTLELGFVVVMTGAMVALPLSGAAFGRAVFGKGLAPAVVVLLSLWPTSHRFAHVYGQLPMLVATPLALLAMASLQRFLDSGRRLDLAAMTFLVGATSAAHHVSTIFAAYGCFVVAAGHVLSRAGPSRLQSLGRAMVAALLAGAAIAGVILPFWRFASSQAPQVEIPHVSRDALWLRPLGLEVAEQVVLLAIGLVGSVVTLMRARRAAGLALGTLFFAILSTGMTTPLPKLLFGSQANWLTYDKFHHWAAVLACLLVAPVVARWGPRIGLYLAAGLLPATLVNVSHRASEHLQPPFHDSVEEVLQVLNGPQANRFRHLTLGFGDQFCRFDIYGQSPNVDGDYHTARSDPLLRSSGIGTVDASKYYPKGREVLEGILGRAPELSLRWVLVNDAWYYEPVLASGFELRDVWHSGISLFERPDVPAINEAPAAPAVPRAWGIYWGLGPMCCLALALISFWAARRKSG